MNVIYYLCISVVVFYGIYVSEGRQNEGNEI